MSLHIQTLRKRTRIKLQEDPGAHFVAGCDYNPRVDPFERLHAKLSAILWSEEVNEPEEVQPEGGVRRKFPPKSVTRKIIVTQNPKTRWQSGIYYYLLYIFRTDTT